MTARNSRSTVVTPGATSANLRAAYARAELISSRDRSSLYRVSQFFPEHDRYLAFIAMYSVMRQVDDIVDGPKGFGNVTDRAERVEAFATGVAAASMKPCHDGLRSDPALAHSLKRFPPLPGVWDRYFDAMRFDLRRSDFARFADFQDYCAGASGSPTTIFLQLIFAVATPTGSYALDERPCLVAGRALGEWAYLIHNLRDLGADLTGLLPVNQFDAETLSCHSLNRRILMTAAARGGFDGDCAPCFTDFVHDILDRAEVARRQGEAAIDHLLEHATSIQRFMLSLIVRLYEAVAERLRARPAAALERGAVTLSAGELLARSALVARTAGLSALPEAILPATRLASVTI
jgi:phytoene/squalene synthetase